jgi:hypothetical protein
MIFYDTIIKGDNMKEEIDHDQLEYELTCEYEKYIHLKVSSKEGKICGIILSTIYEESISDIVFKIIKVKDKKEYDYVLRKIKELENEVYSNIEENDDPYEILTEKIKDLSYELDDVGNNLFFVKRDDLILGNHVQLKWEELKDSCYYRNNERFSYSWGSVEITSGAYKGQVGYYDDDDIDEEGRPCGIVYLGKLFESSYLLLPYGSFKVTCKNNPNTDEFVEKNDELSKMLGVVNTKLN